jgi:pimeloyl-ACP methyl ester carboxylesterase
VSGRSGLTERAEAWRRTGELAEIDGRRIFVHARPAPGPGRALPLLFLHGYPSSSFDWRLTLDLLARSGHVAFDFLGFGLSEKPRDVPYSLHLQADLAEAVAIRYARDQPVVLVAHDMGTSAATELLARSLEGRLRFALHGVLLLNGSMVIERASLTISQKALRSRLGPLVARFANERAFRAQFARIFSQQHPLDPQEAADQWALLAHGDGHRIIHRLTYYLNERVIFADRWHGALRDWPGHLGLAWAGRDPVCTEAVLQAVMDLRPQAPVTRLPELGHYPQLEDPAAVAAVVDRFVRDCESAAA